MKKHLIITGFGVLVLVFFAITFFYMYKTENRIFAQTNSENNTNCRLKNSSNTSNIETAGKCDFSKYKTLRVQSLKIESLPQPEYPTETSEKNIGGCVPIRILVDKDGKVSESCDFEKSENVKDCKNRIDDEIFKNSAKEAALKAKFDVSRTSLNGNDFFEMTIIYNFTPSEKSKSAQ